MAASVVDEYLHRPNYLLNVLGANRALTDEERGAVLGVRYTLEEGQAPALDLRLRGEVCTSDSIAYGPKHYTGPARHVRLTLAGERWVRV